MEKSSIPIIAIAVFMCVILLAQNNLEKAFALTTWNTALLTDPTSLVYSSSFQRWIVIHTGGVIDTINPATHARTTITLPTSITRIYQPSIGCPANYCVVVQDGTGSSDRVLTINPITGAIITNTTTGISGLSTVQNGNTVMPNGYYIGVCTVGTARVARSIDGIQYGVCGGSTMGAQNILNSASGTTKTAFINDGASAVQVWDNTALTLTCSVAVSAGTGGEVVYYSSNFYVVISTTTINKYAESNCAAGTGITGTSLTTQFQGLRYNTGRDEFYVLSTTTLAVMNLSSSNISTLLYTVDLGSSNSGKQTMDVNTAGEQVARSSTTGSGFVYGVNLNDNNNGLAGETGNDFCDQPENANILICVNGGDGTLGSAGAFIIGNTTNGTGVLGIGCSLGFVDCVSDPDPQTNGLGLLIFLASLLLIVGFFYATMGYGAFSIHPFIWVLIIIVDAAFFTLTGIIDPVFLILAIIAIIALAAPRLKDVISRGTSFGSGSTE
jgi:hypothetical protein